VSPNCFFFSQQYLRKKYCWFWESFSEKQTLAFWYIKRALYRELKEQWEIFDISFFSLLQELPLWSNRTKVGYLVGNLIRAMWLQFISRSIYQNNFIVKGDNVFPLNIGRFILPVGAANYSVFESFKLGSPEARLNDEMWAGRSPQKWLILVTVSEGKVSRKSDMTMILRSHWWWPLKTLNYIFFSCFSLLDRLHQSPPLILRRSCRPFIHSPFENSLATIPLVIFVPPPPPPPFGLCFACTRMVRKYEFSKFLTSK